MGLDIGGKDTSRNVNGKSILIHVLSKGWRDWNYPKKECKEGREEKRE